MTTPSNTVTEAAHRAAKLIKEEFIVTSVSELTAIIAAEFAPLGAELERLRAEVKAWKETQVH